MENRLEQYLGLHYSTIVVPDMTTSNQPCYLAYHPELEGCMSHGITPEEALQNLSEVTELYISTLLDKGLEVPLPQGMPGVTWDIVVPTGKPEADISISPSIASPTIVPVA